MQHSLRRSEQSFGHAQQGLLLDKQKDFSGVNGHGDGGRSLAPSTTDPDRVKAKWRGCAAASDFLAWAFFAAPPSRLRWISARPQQGRRA
jgi:hypothetical protein